MPEFPLSAIGLSSGLGDGQVGSVNLRALGIHAITQEIWSAYATGVDALEFCSAHDRMDVLRFQRVLKDYDTLSILQVIWKESRHISDIELKAFGAARLFCNRHLTCWGLAKEIARTTHDVGKVQKRISTIVEAGAAYGLIESEKIRSKMVRVEGTKRLHDFMLVLAMQTEGIIRSHMGVVSESGHKS